MSSTPGLGKGLTNIFGQDVSRILDDIQNAGTAEGVSQQTNLPVSEIRPNPYQPRKIFEQSALEELADSIRQHGVFTPILVRKSIHGYDLIAGERRLRASKMAGRAEIPAIIVDFDEQQMMEISLLENIQREDLNVIEEARAYNELIKNLHYTQEQLAARVGKSREHITNLLRLLKLPENVQNYVIAKQLSMGHARALLGLKDPSQMQKLASQAISAGWSVRRMEQAVKMANEAQQTKTEDPMENLFVREACRQLEDYFQTSVRITGSSISIHYEDQSDLTRILEKLGKSSRLEKELRAFRQPCS